ncbi:aminotransferase class IV [Marinobacter sp. M1N3S26]|uniref:aminotransferase class IV n=1 Tax=Marinobacter sp. M1N3S26 TaxID=3382299 RepID=UPI00387B7576
MVNILVSGSGEHGPATVPGDDRGLAYGDGLFETILVRHGRPELVQAHCQRMLGGACRLGIPLVQADLDLALQQGQTLIERTRKTDRQVLKLLLTRGSGGRGYRPPEAAEPRLLISLHVAPPEPPGEGVAASISDVPLTVNPLLAGLKTLNRLEQVLASRAMPEGCYEALMRGDRGDLREGTRTSLLYRWRGEWCTPPRDQVAVNSVMLAHVAQGLAVSGQGVREGFLQPEQCHQDDFGGLLLLNSVIGAVPVHTLAGRQLPLPDHLATIVSLARKR